MNSSSPSISSCQSSSCSKHRRFVCGQCQAGYCVLGRPPESTSQGEIAETLSVGKTKISEWLSRTVKDNKEKRDRKIFDLWLACWTQEEIAEAVGVEKQRVGEVICPDLASLPKADKAAAEHAVDFDVRSSG